MLVLFEPHVVLAKLLGYAINGEFLVRALYGGLRDYGLEHYETGV